MASQSRHETDFPRAYRNAAPTLQSGELAFFGVISEAWGLRET